MGRRFLQRLKQRVAGFRGQHMGLVDDIDLVAAVHRCKVRVLIQVLNIFHAAVRRRIQFLHIHGCAFRDLDTVAAFAAGRSCRAVLTVQRLGKDARRGGLARTPGAGKQISMGNPARGQGIT